MLSDRPYMREPQYQPSPLKPLYWLIGIMVGVFIVQTLVINWFQSPFFQMLFALSEYGIKHGYIWTFLTYGFLHSTNGSIPVHLLLNCLGLFFLGRILLPLLGKERFFTLFGISVFLGGLLWFAINHLRGYNIPLVGASAGIMGLLVAFTMQAPNRPITVLLFLFLPVTITPRNLVRIVLIFELVGFFLSELAPFGNGLGIAHSAHLGGMFGGWVFVKFILHKDFTIGTTDIKPPRWFSSEKIKKAKTGRFKINFTNRNELQKEVDRILDKINQEGFGALSEEERSTLDKAKELLNR
ncbi:MAG: rhomboid family intramembrane serine protease [Verrucomicrobia bacterium]|nr:rhomboid family intramembrane serine protease [Verrucomicrobiota bacterium]MDA1065191.1 rhomboid family intramembrane serine protease [Verrucomicrobiota bacterium]